MLKLSSALVLPKLCDVACVHNTGGAAEPLPRKHCL